MHNGIINVNRLLGSFNEVKNRMKNRDDLGVMTISADTTSGNLVVWSNAAFAKRVN